MMMMVDSKDSLATLRCAQANWCPQGIGWGKEDGNGACDPRHPLVAARKGSQSMTKSLL